MSNSLQTHALQHTRLPCPSPSPRVCSNSCPLSQWCHPTISSSVLPFSSCLQSSPASGSFPMGWLFISGGQSIGVSASTSVLPMNIQGWCPIGLTGWTSLQPKGLSRDFFSTTVQKQHCSKQWWCTVFFKKRKPTISYFKWDPVDLIELFKELNKQEKMLYGPGSRARAGGMSLELPPLKALAPTRLDNKMTPTPSCSHGPRLPSCHEG